MRDSTFFRVIRGLWIGVTVVAVIVSVSGLRDLSPVMLMLSFPASVIVGLLRVIATDALGWNEPLWLDVGIVIGAGYVQWFVTGRALARWISTRLPTHRLVSIALRGVTVVAFIGLGTTGLEMVRAQEGADAFVDRAVTVRDGMTMEEVRSILGDPGELGEPTEQIGDHALCSPPAVRGALYWYEHPSLPRRLASGRFFTLVACFDRHDHVIDTDMLHGH